MSSPKVPAESTTRRRKNAKCEHIDLAGDSTIEVHNGQAWCGQCGEGKPREPTIEDLDAVAKRLYDESVALEENAREYVERRLGGKDRT